MQFAIEKGIGKVVKRKIKKILRWQKNMGCKGNSIKNL